MCAILQYICLRCFLKLHLSTIICFIAFEFLSLSQILVSIFKSILIFCIKCNEKAAYSCRIGEGLYRCVYVTRPQLPLKYEFSRSWIFNTCFHWFILLVSYMTIPPTGNPISKSSITSNCGREIPRVYRSCSPAYRAHPILLVIVWRCNCSKSQSVIWTGITVLTLSRVT